MSRQHAPEFFPDAEGKHRWRLWSSNARIIAAADTGFSSKDLAAADLTGLGVALANPKLYPRECYRDARGEWRWRVWDGSEIRGSSSEGYKNHSDAVSNMDLVKSIIERWTSLGAPL